MSVGVLEHLIVVTSAGIPIRFRTKPMNLCTYVIEECECGVSVNVNATILFAILQVVGITEPVRTVIRFRKKTMNLCELAREYHELGVGVDVNDTMLLMVGTDLLDGVTDTPEVSQRSEAGQRILCTKEDIGKYDMWYGVRQLHNL
jgi:hypothetical protein